MLKARLLIGALLIAAAVGIVVVDNHFAPHYPLTALGIGLAVAVAARELAHLLMQLPVVINPVFCQVGCLAIVGSNWAPALGGETVGAVNLAFPFSAFVALSMGAFVFSAWRLGDPSAAVFSVLGHVLVLFYVGALGSFVVQTRLLGPTPGAGAISFCLTVFTAKTCDMGAYFGGRWLGRRKLAPVLSPGKTVEGALAGLFVAVALAFAIVGLGQYLEPSWSGLTPLQTVVFGLVVGLAAQVGDLMESLIKRGCKRKDASDAIPGFGGLLDIIDSVLFSSPVAYLLLTVF